MIQQTVEQLNNRLWTLKTTRQRESFLNSTHRGSHTSTTSCFSFCLFVFLVNKMRTSDIWNVSYSELRIWNQVSHDHRSFECNLSNWEQKPEKVRTSTGFEPVTSRGSNPVEVLTFSGFCSQLLKLGSKLRWSWLSWRWEQSGENWIPVHRICTSPRRNRVIYQMDIIANQPINYYLLDVIYQTRGRVFHQISKHWEVRWRNEAQSSLF